MALLSKRRATPVNTVQEVDLLNIDGLDSLDKHPRVAAVLARRGDTSAERRACVRELEDAKHDLLMLERQARGLAARDEQTTAEAVEGIMQARRRVEALELTRQLMQREGTPALDEAERLARLEATREINLALKKASLPALRAFVELCEQALPHWKHLSKIYGYHLRLCGQGTEEALASYLVQPFPNETSLERLRWLITSYETSAKEDAS